MMGNTVVTAQRQDLLEELRGRLNARVAAVEKRFQALREEFDKLAQEHIELSAELRVLEDQVLKCKGRGDEGP
jgi:chaperonin cofactor prefoldin